MAQIHIKEIKTALNRVLVKDLTITLNPKDRIALIGEEGNGKSTLLKVIGHVHDDFIDQLKVQIHEEKPQPFYGYLAQQLSLEVQMMLAYDFLEVDQLEAQQRKLLSTFLQTHLGFEIDDLYRLMNTYSGGEKVKLQILHCMLGNVDIYLLDEPTNDLDMETIEWLEQWMLEQVKPILFVSHDVRLLKNVSNKIVHLEQRKRKQEAVSTIYQGDYSSYIEFRNRSIDHNNQVSRKEKDEFDKRMDRWTKLYQQVDHQQKSISRQDPHGGALLKKHMRHLKSQKRQLDRKELTSKIEPEEAIELFFNVEAERRRGLMLHVEVDQLIAGDKRLGGPYVMDIAYQDKIGLIGRNGIGKTTFIQHIVKGARRKNLSVSIMEQDYFQSLDRAKSIIENLTLDKDKDEITRIRNILGSLKFTAEEMEHAMSELSLGQVAKVSLLKLILDPCDLIILDEPTRNLSPLSFNTITQMFIDVPKTIVCISHDREFLSQVCNRIIEMQPHAFIEKNDIINS